jgi:hypothetical protein
MKQNEAGCCWCANSFGSDFRAFINARNQCFANLYPFSDSSGTNISLNKSCGPGYDCANMQNGIISANPRYTSSCFSRGISPYLLRLAKDDHRMAYEIWGHGRLPTTINDYGVVYRPTDLEIKRNQKDISIKFKNIMVKNKIKGTIYWHSSS